MPYAEEMPPSSSSVDGRHLRVGNMVQIVPADPNAQETDAADAAGADQVQAASSSVDKEIPSDPAKALMQKMEEMKRSSQRRDAERKRRREQRLAEQMQEGGEAQAEGEPAEEVPQVPGTGGGRILERLEEEEQDRSAAEAEEAAKEAARLKAMAAEEEAREARVLREAMTSIPDEDEEVDQGEGEVE